MTLYQSFRKYLKKNTIPEEQGSVEGSSILFKQNNLYYVFLYDNDTPNYFRLLLPKIAGYDHMDEAALNKMALEASAEYKVAKLVVIDNQIWASFEQIILDPDAENSEIYNMGIRILNACYIRISSFVKTHKQDVQTER